MPLSAIMPPSPDASDGDIFPATSSPARNDFGSDEWRGDTSGPPFAAKSARQGVFKRPGVRVGKARGMTQHGGDTSAPPFAAKLAKQSVFGRPGVPSCGATLCGQQGVSEGPGVLLGIVSAPPSTIKCFLLVLLSTACVCCKGLARLREQIRCISHRKAALDDAAFAPIRSVLFNDVSLRPVAWLRELFWCTSFYWVDTPFASIRSVSYNDMFVQWRHTPCRIIFVHVPSKECIGMIQLSLPDALALS